MPKETNELTQLESYLEWMHSTKQSRALQTQLRTLCDQLRPHFKKNAYSEYPPLSREECESLRQTYRDCLTACKAAKDKVKMMPYIISTLQNDLDAIRYDDAVLNSLPDMLAAGRTQVLRMTDDGIANVGASMSSRVPVTYHNQAGREVTGYFTKSVTFSPAKKIQAALEQAEAACPTNELQWLKTLLGSEVFRKDLLENFLGAQAYGQAFLDKSGNNPLSPNNLKEFLTKCGLPEDVVNHWFSATETPMRTVLGNLLMNVSSVLGQKGVMDMAGIVLNSRLDQRNCAMSAMANLLGTPELLAQSKPMTLVQPDGQSVQGIFMESARGTDLSHMSPEEAAQFQGQDIETLTPEILPQLASMQVLDYLCGNIDRHNGNMLYQFEHKDGKARLVGITGIDNDTSFGTITERKADQSAPDEMLVLPASVGRRILELNQETLFVTLKPFGLSEAELNAAWTRTQQMQEKIQAGLTAFQNEPENEFSVRTGCIRLLEDDQWGRLTQEQLTKKAPDSSRTRNNLFKRVWRDLKDNLQYSMEHTVEKPERKFNAAQDMGLLSGYGMAASVEKLEAISQKFLAADAANGGSKEFKAMYNAFENLRKAQNDRAKYKHPEKKLSQDAANELQKNLRAVQEATKAYILAKGSNPYTQKGKDRLAAANELYGLCMVQIGQVQKWSDAASNAAFLSGMIDTTTKPLQKEIQAYAAKNKTTPWDKAALKAQRELVEMYQRLDGKKSLPPRLQERAYRDMATLAGYALAHDDRNNPCREVKTPGDCTALTNRFVAQMKAASPSFKIPPMEKITLDFLCEFVADSKHFRLANTLLKQAVKQQEAPAKQDGGKAL